ncbi:MAG TPA: hypothetical protein PKN36_04510 [bacterium]|nr:hypothetical protein [bacterium]
MELKSISLVPFLLIMVNFSILLAGDEIRKESQLRVLKTGETVYIRSSFSEQDDIVTSVGLGRNNRQINILGTFLLSRTASMDIDSLKTERYVHRMGDDAAGAWLINKTGAIGGNHGLSGAIDITCPDHGRTVKDLGSEWEDINGKKFYLVRIVSEDKLLFLGKNTSTGDIWKFDNRLKGSTLKSIALNAVITFPDVKISYGAKPGGVPYFTQLWPACRINKLEYLLNGKIPLKEGEAASCEWFDIVEEYDIVNPGAVLADIISHPGQERNFVAKHLDAVLSDNTIYRFFPNGACVVYQRAKALQDFSIQLFLGVMTAQLTRNDGGYQTHEYYIPKTLPFTLNDVNYDFSRVQDFAGVQDSSRRLSSSLNFSVEDKNIADPQNPPDRFIQFLGKKEGEKTAREVGFALGYSLTHGMSVPSERVKNTSRFLQIPYTCKTYPATADSKMGNVSKGTDFYFVGYRQYFNPRLSGNATCFYWHKQENDTIVYADYHKSVQRDIIKLPAELAGKKFEVIEKTPSLILHAENTVPENGGLEVSVTDNYGYLVFRVF